MTTTFENPHALLDAVGQHLGYSDWLEIDQQRINLFADATGDHQWIHVDPEKAAEGPFGSTIAHGYLTLSLANLFLPQIMQVNNTSMGVNYGCDKVRFPAAVPVGSRRRAWLMILVGFLIGAVVDTCFCDESLFVMLARILG